MARQQVVDLQDAKISSRARELRHSDTPAWRLLRNRQLLHYKFHRQLPLNNAIVNFCCLSLKLVVELDGARHAHESQVTRDWQRDRELEKAGYRVLRFPNGIVLKAPHRPVGARSLERAPSLKILKHHVSYPPHPPAPEAVKKLNDLGSPRPTAGEGRCEIVKKFRLPSPQRGRGAGG